VEQTLIHVRVCRENKDYLDTLTSAPGVSQAAAVDAILTEARERGWTVTGQVEVTAP
jgi:hypothetical protein